MEPIYYAPSIFETYNARHLSPARIAETFVAPSDIFSTLATKNNHIIVGPRGSGKTTLLKMLTLPALQNWNPKKFNEILPKVDFIGIFVPADRGWQSQIERPKGISFGGGVGIGDVVFTTHVLRSLILTFEHFFTYHAKPTEAVTSVPKELVIAKEREAANLIAETWGIKLRLQSFAGLKLALLARQTQLKSLIPHLERSSDPTGYLLEAAPYATLDYREALKFGIEVYEVISKSDPHTWALLFDEFEIAPNRIQRDVLGRLRGDASGNIISKLALAPFNENFMLAIRENDSSKRNDYEVVDLWFPRKRAAEDFSNRLFQMNLHERKMENESPTSAFGISDFTFDEEDDASPYEESGEVFNTYTRLANIDRSFAGYLKKHHIDLTTWSELDESARAQIRKFRSIVITREYFRSKANPHSAKRVINKTSRKIDTIYTGAPTILALCEGNPRILIGLLSPLIRRLQIERAKSKKKRVPKNFQAGEIKATVNAFRALLKTVVHDSSDDMTNRGLLRMLDEIGDYFHRKCVVDPFSPQPHLTFTVPSNADEGLISLVGRALNMGAIIYIPDRGADPILTSLKGKRFRLSYLLSAYYRLPIIINEQVSLNKILKHYSASQQKSSQPFGQVDLFEDYGEIID